MQRFNCSTDTCYTYQFYFETPDTRENVAMISKIYRDEYLKGVGWFLPNVNLDYCYVKIRWDDHSSFLTCFG